METAQKQLINETSTSACVGLFVCWKCGGKARHPKARHRVGWVGWMVLGILAYVAIVLATADVPTNVYFCAESVILVMGIALYFLFSRKECACPCCGRTNCLTSADGSEVASQGQDRP